jgi:hypothetical protein
MHEPRTIPVTVASFSRAHALIHAIRVLRKNGVNVLDAFTPFPVHGIEDALGVRRSRLPVVCFIAASAGAILSMAFQVWTSAYSWPVNVGGKPFVSWLAFAPVTFEVMVLLGGLVTVAAFLWRSRLSPGVRAWIAGTQVTHDRFWIAIAMEEARIDEHKLREMLVGLEASDIAAKEMPL